METKFAQKLDEKYPYREKDFLEDWDEVDLLLAAILEKPRDSTFKQTIISRN